MDRRILPALLALLATVLALSAIGAQGKRITRSFTERGEWKGSWVFVSRDEHVAFFMRGPAERPELKVRYEHQTRPEQFETGWDGRAAYFFAGKPGLFEISLEDTSASRLHGSWRREFTLSGTRVAERGAFTIARSGDGRWLLLDFDDLRLGRQSADGVVQERSTSRSWTFRKVSRRVVRWEELPR